MTEDTTRKTFEPTLRCIARHAVQFAVLFILVSTIGSWITGAEP